MEEEINIEEPTIICPYVFENEIQRVRDNYWELPIVFERDDAKIGSDLMYQKMWNSCDNDVFIFHADMSHMDEESPNTWYENFLPYVSKYPEAGIIGCLLLYPAKDDEGNYYIEHAGGQFDEDGNPDHIGSGVDVQNQKFFKEPIIDTGQFDHVREIPWITFGGIYIRRQVLDEIGDFDPSYEWTYNRDVEYCMRVREAGWKIYQVPVKIIHMQSADNKRLATPENRSAEARNLEKVKAKWQSTEFWKNLDRKVDE